MTSTIALVRLVPWVFLGRLGAAVAEIAVAAVIVSGSVVVGHALRDWRAWYGDPAVTHPWAPTVAPSATTAAATTPSPAPAATPSGR